ncbi:MAG: FecR domain-containing protein [Pseudobacter sp.]|uniref:FecR domain-containing protein n=1 Tax=Pseudobacter sp. TaxID=2045420 RepID=UPI003F7DB577
MNAEFYNMSDDLLVKFLLDEASASERREVEHWIDADPEHRQYFEQFKFIWDRSQELAVTTEADENDAWKRFQQRVSGEQDIPVMTVVKPVRKKWYDTRVAAAVIMLVGVAALLYYILVPFRNSNSKQVVLAATAEAKAETLPDGSVITLNRNSSISYAAEFKGNKRNVKLNGEAFFQVKPDISKPFIVTINDVTITVLGTSFNVKSANGKTEVIVESGLVKVEHDSKSVQLKQREKLEIEANDSALTKEPVTDQFYKFYRTREIVCDNTPLWKLVQVLNEAYNVNIVIENPALKSLEIDVPFYNVPLEEVLNVIQETFPQINLSKKDSLIILK